MPQYPRLVFHPTHDDRGKEEMTPRGYVTHVYAVTGEGRYFPVFFHDPVRLGQDLEALYADGYFDHLVSVQPEPGSA